MTLVEAYNDTALKTELSYPVGPLIAIPDGFARTEDGRWLVWEQKGRDNVQKALHQLEEGVRNLLKLGQSVDHLGITLERFDGAERWKCNSLGYLMPKAQVHATPYEVCGRKVWVEQRGR